jgi:hypothetical protein
VTFDQLLYADCFIVLAILKPRIFINVWYVMPIMLMVVFHVPMAMALDFLMF